MAAAIPLNAQSGGSLVLLTEPVLQFQQDKAVSVLSLVNRSKEAVPLNFSTTLCGNTPMSPVDVKFTSPPAAIKPDERIAVEMTSEEPSFAGDVQIPICNNHDLIAKIQARNEKDLAPIKLDATPAENPVIEVGDKSPGYLIRNDDSAVTYYVKWSLQAGAATLSGKLRMLPSSVQEISLRESGCGFQCGWWDSIWSRLKNPMRDSALVIELDTSGIPQLAAKRIPVRLQRQTASAIAVVAWTALLLFAGALGSIFLFNYIPNRRRQQTLLTAIDELGPVIANLSTILPAEVRVGVGVERNRLHAMMTGSRKKRKLSWMILPWLTDTFLRLIEFVSPDFVPQMDRCQAALSTLKQRIELLCQLDGDSQCFHALKHAGLPPSIIEEVSVPIKAALHFLGKPNPLADDLVRAKAAVSEVSVSVNALIGSEGDPPDEKLRKQLAESLAFVKKSLAQPEARVEAALPGLFAKFKATTDDESEMNTSLSFRALDWTVHKLLILSRYDVFLKAQPRASSAAEVPPPLAMAVAAGTGSDASGTGTSTPTANTVQTAAPASTVTGTGDGGPVTPMLEGKILNSLRCTSWEQLELGDTLVAELEEDVLGGDLCQAIWDQGAFINVDKAMVRQNEGVSLTVTFHKHILNSARAKNRITVRWAFCEPGTDPTEKPSAEAYVETGWEVSRYFAASGTYLVYAEIRDAAGRPVGDAPLSRKVTVSPPEYTPVGARFRIEAIRLMVTLGIALAGLLAGAKDKLDQLGVLNSIFAIIALGFTADSVRKILTQNSDSSSS